MVLQNTQQENIDDISAMTVAGEIPASVAETNSTLDKPNSLSILPDPNKVTRPVGKAVAEAGILGKGIRTPLEKRADIEAETQQAERPVTLDMTAFKDMIVAGQVDEVDVDSLQGALSIVNNPSVLSSMGLNEQQKEEELKSANDLLQGSYSYYKQQYESPKVARRFTDEFGDFEPTVEKEADPLLHSEQRKQFDSSKAISVITSGKFATDRAGNETGLSRKEQTILEQIMVDGVSTHDFMDMVIERINDGLIRSNAQFLGDAALSYVPAGVSAGGYYAAKGIGSMVGITDSIQWNEAWKATEGYRNKVQETWDKTLSDSAAIQDINETWSEFIRDRLEEKRQAGEINDETYNRLISVKVPQADGTEKDAPINYLSDEDVYQVMNTATNLFSKSERFMLSFVEAAGLVTADLGTKAKKSLKVYDDLVEDVQAIRKAGGAVADKIKDVDDVGAFFILKHDNDFRDLLKKYNEKDVLRGIDMNHSRVGFKRLKDGINDTDMKIRDLEMKKGFDLSRPSVEYLELTRKRESLTNQLIRAKFLNNMPVSVIWQGVKDTTLLSVAQYNAGELLTDAFGGDRLTAEAMGSIGYLTAGKGGLFITGKMLSYANSAAGDLTNQLALGIESLIDVAGYEKLTGRSIGGLLSDADVTAYANLLRQNGMNVGSKEIRALNYVRKLSARLAPENRDQVARYARTMREAQEKILAMWDPEDTEGLARARQTFSLSTASLTNLSWMRASEQLALGKISAKELTSLTNVNEAQTLQNFRAFTLQQGSEFVAQLESQLKNANITDVKSRKIISDYIGVLKQGLVTSQEHLNADGRDLSEKVMDARDLLLSSRFTNADHSVISRLEEVHLDVQKRLNPELDELAEANKLATQRMEMHTERAKDLTKFNLNYGTGLRLARGWENLIGGFLTDAKKTARRGFIDLDKKAISEEKSVDVTDLVRRMFRIAKDENAPSTSSALGEFFGRDSAFFAGNLGKRARKAFNEMARREIDKLPNTTFEKMRLRHSTPVFSDGTKNDEFISEDVSPLEIVIWHSENGELGAFKALPGEVMDVISAFAEYGARIRNDSLSARYFEFVTEAKEIIPQEYRDEWDSAARIYQAEWWDRIRLNGPITKTFAKNGVTTVGARERAADNGSDYLNFEDLDVNEVYGTEINTSIFTRNYKGNDNPVTMLNNFVEQVSKAIYGNNKATTINEIGVQFNTMLQELASRDEKGNAVFRADSPEDIARLRAISGYLSAYIYDAWGKDAQRSLKAITSGQTEVVGAFGAVDIPSAFPSINVDDLENLQQALRFPVRYADGSSEMINIVDLGGILETNNSIFHELSNSKAFAQKVVELRADVVGKVEAAATEAVRNKRILQVGQDSVIKASNIPIDKPEDFLMNVFNIGEGGLYRIQDMKRNALINLVGAKKFKEGGGDVSSLTVNVDGQDVNAVEVIDQAFRSMVINGMMNVARLKTEGGKTLLELPEGQKVLKTFDAPAEGALLFEGEQGAIFRKNLTALLVGTESLSYNIPTEKQMKDAERWVDAIEGAFDFLASQAKTDLTRVEIDNLFRPLTTNHFISRSYSLVRGQVSMPYISGELAIAIATAAGIDMMKMAATSRENAEFVLRVMEYPQSMTKKDFEKFGSATFDFVYTEMSRLGLNMVDYLPEGTPEDIQKYFTAQLIPGDTEG